MKEEGGEFVVFLNGWATLVDESLFRVVNSRQPTESKVFIASLQQMVSRHLGKGLSVVVEGWDLLDMVPPLSMVKGLVGLPV